METVFDSFPFFKSISHKERMSALAAILANKTAQDLTFTAIDDDGLPIKCVLGSVQGNTFFLLGKVSPAFCFAPYHLQVMDPTLSDEDANLIYKIKGHPAILELWGDNPLIKEGDLLEGKPHPGVSSIDPPTKTFKFKAGGLSYEADPNTQLVTCKNTKHVYAWSLVRNTWLSSQVPKLAEVMDVEEFAIEKSTSVPSNLVYLAEGIKGASFPDDVFPLVKGVFPKPGSVVDLKEDGYAVILPDSVAFYDRQGSESKIIAFGEQLDSNYLDVFKGGNIHQCAILTFANKYLNLDLATLEKLLDA